jgi:hypothetical protein
MLFLPKLIIPTFKQTLRYAVNPNYETARLQGGFIFNPHAYFGAWRWRLDGEIFKRIKYHHNMGECISQPNPDYTTPENYDPAY